MKLLRIRMVQGARNAPAMGDVTVAGITTALSISQLLKLLCLPWKHETIIKEMEVPVLSWVV